MLSIKDQEKFGAAFGSWLAQHAPQISDQQALLLGKYWFAGRTIILKKPAENIILFVVSDLDISQIVPDKD